MLLRSSSFESKICVRYFCVIRGHAVAFAQSTGVGRRRRVRTLYASNIACSRVGRARSTRVLNSEVQSGATNRIFSCCVFSPPSLVCKSSRGGRCVMGVIRDATRTAVTLISQRLSLTGVGWLQACVPVALISLKCKCRRVYPKV